MEEYLGKEYPLFYDNIENIPNLLTLEKIEETYNYMKNIDNSFLRIETFIKSFQDLPIYKNLMISD